MLKSFWFSQLRYSNINTMLRYAIDLVLEDTLVCLTIYNTHGHFRLISTKYFMHLSTIVVPQIENN